jgi:predicted transposase YdaD
MAKSGKQDAEDSQPSQQFDTTLKDWLRQAAASVLSILLPGAIYTETLTIELIRPTIRADKVFKITYEAMECIFHIEFESGSDTYMAARMNAYNAILFNDYHIPVVSMIIYPFRTTMATSPLEIGVSGRDITTFHFLTLPLFTMEAEQYVRNHVLSMYPLLPTMNGANRAIIKQAVGELAELYREDEVTLAQQIIWMELLLERTDTVPLPEKRGIQEELKVYDPLWEENSKVRRMRAESEAKGRAEGLAEGEARGRAEGEAKGEAKGLQIALVSAVKVRFPELTELAQQTVEQINDTTGLDMLLKHVITAPDERTARWLLSSAA